MGSLKLTSGHLTRTSGGHLAICSDCFCSEEQRRDFSGCGKCLEVAYGAIQQLDYVTWTISGTPFVYENRQGGLPYVPLNSNSPSVNGTYIIPCGETQEWWHCAHVGTRTFGVPSPIYYFYSLMALFQWSSGVPRVTIWSGVFSNFTGTNPYPTLAQGGAPAINQDEATRVVSIVTPGTLDDWAYNIGGACQAECNTPTTRPECFAADPMLNDSSGYQNPGDKHDHVEVADLDITCAVTHV